MDRFVLLHQITNEILSLPNRVKVAVDGPDAAGKTTLAGELEGIIQNTNTRQVLRASIDWFHHPREVRYRRYGSTSPLGYYYDAFDLAALREYLLDPLKPEGSGRVQTAWFDYRANRPLPASEHTRQAAADAILIFDGVFLMRPELSEAWDYFIFVQVDFNTILSRAQIRDQPLFGTDRATRDRYLNRYLPAQQVYLSRYRPDLHANAVIINDDPTQPELIRPNPL